MSNFLRHPFHLVDESPWPLIRAFSVFFITRGIVCWFQLGDLLVISLGRISLFLNAYQWWRDISGEGSFQGRHSGVVELGLRWGILLFIVSEIFFFISFFWCYFHISLSPSVDLGRRWAPIGIEVLNPIEIPLLNTVILVVSGISVTWSHHSLIEGNHRERILGLIMTLFLGLAFTVLQALEYAEVRFRICDRVYGSIFFIATGFHGVHVIVGSIFLCRSLIRIYKGYFRCIHHFGFEARVWYWHFVDVVWLFLYLVIYWWGRL
jgi:cytochrome c oxidase subunit 3